MLTPTISNSAAPFVTKLLNKIDIKAATVPAHPAAPRANIIGNIFNYFADFSTKLKTAAFSANTINQRALRVIHQAPHCYRLNLNARRAAAFN